MKGLATIKELRWSFARVALVTVPAVLLLGTLSGRLSGSGAGDPWYAALDKPSFQPPGWAFGIVWPLLYIAMGLSLAMVVAARGARGRRQGIALFAVQLAINLAWSPIFFAAHRPRAALVTILVLIPVVMLTLLRFWSIRVRAGMLLVPYFGWICFAALLNWAIVERNPTADGTTPAASAQIGVTPSTRR